MSTTIKEELTYNKALTLLGKKDSRKLQNQTYLIRDPYDKDIYIRHWNTNIINYKPDRSIVLNLRGWHTVTTKERVRTYTPVHLYSDRGTLAVWDKEDISYVFEDGVTLQPDGSIQNARPLLATKLETITGKDIPDKETMIQFLENMDLDMSLKVWKKCKKHRTLIAKYCPKDFLPLTLGFSKGGESWVEIVSARMRGDNI